MNLAKTRLFAEQASEHIGARARTLLDAIVRHWLRVLLGATLAVAIALALWQSSFPIAAGEDPMSCWPQSLVTLSTPKACIESLYRVTKGPLRTDSQGATAPLSSERWDSEGMFVWTDNVFVDMYTLLFLGGCAAGYARRRVGDQPPSASRRWLLGITFAACLFGALADHIENFWLLAHIGAAADYASEAKAVAFFTAWKFRLFTLNLALLAWWTLLGPRESRNSQQTSARAPKTGSSGSTLAPPNGPGVESQPVAGLGRLSVRPRTAASTARVDR